METPQYRNESRRNVRGWYAQRCIQIGGTSIRITAFRQEDRVGLRMSMKVNRLRTEFEQRVREDSSVIISSTRSLTVHWTATVKTLSGRGSAEVATPGGSRWGWSESGSPQISDRPQHSQQHLREARPVLFIEDVRWTHGLTWAVPIERWQVRLSVKETVAIGIAHAGGTRWRIRGSFDGGRRGPLPMSNTVHPAGKTPEQHGELTMLHTHCRIPALKAKLKSSQSLITNALLMKKHEKLDWWRHCSNGRLC